MGGQPSAGGKPSVAGNFYWGETYMVAKSTSLGEIHSCKPFYPYYHWPMHPGHPYLGVLNPLWDQPNPVQAFLSKELCPINMSTPRL
jgi:hypothetical protein